MRAAPYSAVLVIVAAALAGCSHGDEPVVPTLDVTNCEGSFLNLDTARDPQSGVGLDDAQLYTLQMCSSRKEWLDTAAGHSQALNGARPEVLLLSICKQVEGSAAYPACQETAEPSDS